MLRMLYAVALVLFVWVMDEWMGFMALLKRRS
jgi:hypothetical protein